MKARKLGWAVTALLGIALLGATGTSAGTASAGEPVDGPSGRAAATNGSAAAAAGPKADAKKNEQVQASTAVKTTSTPAPIVTAMGGTCPAGMVEVEGDYCAHVEQTCLRWLDPDEKMRCAEFAPQTHCDGKVTHKHFCIDQFEYPNQPGAKPEIMKSWYQARDACSSQGKRLCGDSEWTLACEGQERMPYPYGYARNADACNIDKDHPDVDEKAIANPATRQAEVDRLWQGEPSGTREACVSPYGVHDMTGNVDEWVVNESGHPYKSGLKGGYWGPVRDRCRPMTTAHNEDFFFYQIGFRCCSEASDSSPAPATAPKASEHPATTRPGAGSGDGPGTINTGASSASSSSGANRSVIAGS